MYKVIKFTLFSLLCISNVQGTTADILNNIFTPDYVKNIDKLPDKDKLNASLFNAVIKKDLAALKTALANGADVTSKAGAYAFIAAAESGNSEMVTAFLAAGIPVDIPLSDTKNIINMNGFTALMIAAMAGHHTIIDILLAAGANVNAESEMGFRPIVCALSNSHRTDQEAAALIKKFIKAGADLNAKIEFKFDTVTSSDNDDDEEDAHERKSPTHINIVDMAMRIGHAETVALLTKAGAAPLDSESTSILQEHIDREERSKKAALERKQKRHQKKRR